jgi:hypothetical protein
VADQLLAKIDEIAKIFWETKAGSPAGSGPASRRLPRVVAGPFRA